MQTKAHSGGGQHPVWNERHTFDLKNMTLDSHLKVKLYVKSTIKDNCIGVAKITLEELVRQDKKGVKNYMLLKKGVESIGQVGVAVTFNCTEIPQRQGDIKSQKSDAITEKDQQVTGVSEPHQETSLPHPEVNLLGPSLGYQQATLPHPEGPGIRQQTLQSMTHPPQAPQHVNQPNWQPVPHVQGTKQ